MAKPDAASISPSVAQAQGQLCLACGPVLALKLLALHIDSEILCPKAVMFPFCASVSLPKKGWGSVRGLNISLGPPAEFSDVRGERALGTLPRHHCSEGKGIFSD